MGNKLKRILYLGLLLIITSCVSATWSNIGINGVMIEHAVETYDNEMALDSICKAEKLPDLSKWKKLDSRSDSGNTFTQYVYVVQTNNKETVYTITVMNKNKEFNFIKREVK